MLAQCRHLRRAEEAVVADDRRPSRPPSPTSATTRAQSGTVLENVQCHVDAARSGFSPRRSRTGPRATRPTPAGTATFPALTPTSGSQTLHRRDRGRGPAARSITQLPVAGVRPLADPDPAGSRSRSTNPSRSRSRWTKPNGTPWVGTANITVIAGSGGTPSYQFSNVSFTAAGTALHDPERDAVPEHRLLRHRAGPGLQHRDGSLRRAGERASTRPRQRADLSNTFTETMVPMGTLDVTGDVRDQLGTSVHSFRFSLCQGPGGRRSNWSTRQHEHPSSGQGNDEALDAPLADFQLPKFRPNATYTVQAAGGGIPPAHGLVDGDAGAKPLADACFCGPDRHRYYRAARAC